MTARALTRDELIEATEIVEELMRRRQTCKILQFRPYDWQQRFFAAGVDHAQRLLMAANRVGKTETGGAELTYHLTGEYPADWPGRRFDHAVDAWALGVSGEQIRDVLQLKLFGRMEGDPQRPDGTGMIPKSAIIIESCILSPQTRGLIKEIRIRHKSGGTSILGLKSYSQGQHVLMGSSKDVILIDEEPKDPEIYPQCLIRTATGDNRNGGILLLTFTPENGMTRLVSQFTECLQPGQYMQTATWDDAPHLTAQVRAQMLAAIPEYQRDMRTSGIPVLGSGLIFPVSDSEIVCDAFDVPAHWRVIAGVDFGWDHPQAIVRLAIDADADVVYVTHCWRASQKDADQAWTATKGFVQGIPTAWPHDGLQTEKGGGQQLRAQYKTAGFSMLADHATWPEGGNSVEAGVYEMLQRFRAGSLKVFRHLAPLLEEIRLYHRDDHGRIVKERDDAISAVRYAYMMRRHAKALMDISGDAPKRTLSLKPPRLGLGDNTGWMAS